ncbi:TPA: DUF3265 domain-containing protein [Vibrio vulnificus]|nr:DUF3265 domain-containing protein [Vibrio vulnificus]HAS8510916.1 DUF3265 domain-containing protein [Vibrio vulnificus]
MVLKCAISNLCVTLARKLTSNLRGIHNAWHFCFYLNLVFMALCVRLGGGVVHPLIGRYVYRRSSWSIGLVF